MLTDISNQMADAAAAAARSVVQVQGRRRPASGVVYAKGVVVTTIQALGGEDGLRVRGEDGNVSDAELAGWDPTTSLAVLKVQALAAPPIAVAKEAARVGHFALAIARSWSNSVDCERGHRVDHRRAIANRPAPRDSRSHSNHGADARRLRRRRVRRHDRLRSWASPTASTIRGLGVVIPSRIAWKGAQDLLEHGRMKRGYIGIAASPRVFRWTARQRRSPEGVAGRRCHREGPAAQAGVIVGDIILRFDGDPISAPEDLLDLLAGDRGENRQRCTSFGAARR